MEQFPHLRFVQKIIGKPRIRGGGSGNEISVYNRKNRAQHSTNLSNASIRLRSNWEQIIAERAAADLAPLEPEVVPLFLRLNPDIVGADFSLQSLGIEIISEEDDGYIIGAAVDNLRALEEKIQEFITATRGSGNIADLWEIVEGDRRQWRKERILSSYLLEQWDSIQDNELYPVEVSIAFDRPIGAEPDPSKQGGEKRLQKYHDAQFERENRMAGRQLHFEGFIKFYGKITSSFVELEDCFGCEIEINGKGLKDLVENYPYVFEVNELEEIFADVTGIANEQAHELEILPPGDEAPVVGVIDSGIMEDHRYLSAAIDSGQSKSYLPQDISTADHVTGGGHGTRVAGAILYPLGISNYSSPYQLPCKIRNLRVLDGSNQIQHRYPASLIQQVINENADCSIFNMSICSKVTYRRKHMSAWAACLDSESFEKDIVFVVAAGNIHSDTLSAYLLAGEVYPGYLEKPNCFIANPAQSCFAISVGSINHVDFEDENWSQLGQAMDVAAFSRCGPGIWGTIKPDVVEFGGGLVVSKNSHSIVKDSKETSPELLRSTLHGGSFNGFDAVGTSFAAPKVTHIVAMLKALYPDESCNLLRALLVQGARLPGQYFKEPTPLCLTQYGFGLPSLARVTNNTEHRISFYNSGEISAEEGHLYNLKIPQRLRDPGEDYEILVEVSLAYTANVRRTRQRSKSYLATWLDWNNSKLEESFDMFKNYALKEIEGRDTAYDREQRNKLDNIHWMIGNRTNSGRIDDISRSNNTLQKDWAFLHSHQLPEELSFSIRGHKGWDKNKSPVPYALVVSLEILGQDIPIYEEISIANEVEIES